MKVSFWGVRGSAAVPDEDKLRYGGNTSSIVVTCETMPDHYFLLDAGTGLARFGGTLGMRDHYSATMFVSHLDLYHIIGFQFTPFAFSPKSETLIIGPSTRNFALESIFDHIMSPSYSPVYGLQNLLAKVQFEEVTTAVRRFGNMEIIALPFDHNEDTECWGYRLQDERASIVYMTDAQFRNGDGSLDANALQLAKGAKVLIVGAFDPAHEHIHFPTYDDVFELARRAGVPRVFLTHHHRDATDDDLAWAEEEAQQLNPDLEIIVAAEGMMLNF